MFPIEQYKDKLSINTQEILGQGTHGTVYQSTISPLLAVKVFQQENAPKYFCSNMKIQKQPSNSCLINKEYEYSYQEKYMHLLNNARKKKLYLLIFKTGCIFLW